MSYIRVLKVVGCVVGAAATAILAKKAKDKIKAASEVYSEVVTERMRNGEVAYEKESAEAYGSEVVKAVLPPLAVGAVTALFAASLIFEKDPEPMNCIDHLDDINTVYINGDRKWGISMNTNDPEARKFMYDTVYDYIDSKDDKKASAYDILHDIGKREWGENETESKLEAEKYIIPLESLKDSVFDYEYNNEKLLMTLPSPEGSTLNFSETWAVNSKDYVLTEIIEQEGGI